MKIEVLGPGCRNCQQLMRNVEEALTTLGVQAEVIKVEEMFEIAGRGVNRTPAIIIDGVLKLQGRVATPQEITNWIAHH